MAQPAPHGLTAAVAAQLMQVLQGPLDSDTLNNAFRLLAKWRSQLVLNTIMTRDGPVVQTGPFQGMIYANAALEGAGATRLLGCYEASLAPVIAQVTARGYDQIIDVGCAEGYYAVGLARLMPNVRVIARDANAAAVQLCGKLAADNGVSDRVTLGGLMAHQDFDICSAAKTLVICDIEGAEADLLDPARAKGLFSADILVETHDCMTAGLSQLIASRFASSHDIQRIDRALDPTALPSWMEALSDLDRLMALWEWRSGPTPWLWMTRKDTT